MTRIYRTRGSARIFWIAFLVFSLIFCTASIRGVVTGSNSWLEVAVGILLVIGGVAGSARFFTAYVSLSDDAIEYGSVFAGQSLLRDQIRFRREYTEYQGGAEGGVDVEYLEFMPGEGINHTVKIPKGDFDFDQAFWDWTSSVPEYR